MIRSHRLLILVLLTFLGLLAPHSFSWTEIIQSKKSPSPQEQSFFEPPQIVMHYCSGCHQSGRANVDFDGPLDLRALQRDRGTWEHALHRLREGEMPPKGNPQPSAEEKQQLIAWIEQGIQAQPGHILARRLTRTEYQNTIRDLFGITISVGEDFPTDDIGWDRSQEIPAVPPPLLEKYRAAAGRILNGVIVSTLPTPLASFNEDEPRDHHEACSPANHPHSNYEAARDSLALFGRRAFRRPLQSHELDHLCAVHARAQGEGKRYEEAIKVAFMEILISPNFLYHIEHQPDPDNSGDALPRNQLALAARLSYLLWSSTPDEPLLADAERGELSHHLESHVLRMLKDPRSRALAQDFAGYWLELTKLKNTNRVDEQLLQDMRKETELLVAHIVREDRNVLEFLDADYTFVNERLAKHYGIMGVYGDAFQRVSLHGTQRAGLLTQGSILTLTSRSEQVSPVLRGKWVLDNLLGTPPGAPPSGVFNSPKLPDPGTARQLLEKHRADPGCAACHTKIDPIGFALDSFDGSGAWRTHELGRSLDTSVTLPTGESFQGPLQLKEYLRGKSDLFIRCLSGKLLSYALSRKLDASNRRAMSLIPARLANNQPHFSSVVLQVVQSAPFQKGWTEE